MEALGVLVRQVRKRRSTAEKRLIVEQALKPSASVARVARAHELNANVVSNWRRLCRGGQAGRRDGSNDEAAAAHRC